MDNDQEEFWRINNLDVVVSSKEQGFIEGIQSEILENSFLMAETFTEQDIRKRLVEQGNLDEKTARQIFKKLENESLIIFKDSVDGTDIFERSTSLKEQLDRLDLPAEQKQIVAKLFSTDIKEFIQNGKTKKDKKKVVIKPSHLKEFEQLWQSIYKNASFILEKMNDEEESQLINNIKTQVEALDIKKIMLETIKSEINVENIDTEGAINKSVIEKSEYISKVNYLALVQNLASDSKMPLSFVVRVFNTLSDQFKQEMLVNNPRQAQKEIADIIQQNLMALLKTKISYGKIEHEAKANIFKTDKTLTYLEAGSTGKFQKEINRDFSLKAKWVFEDVIEYDSDFELEIIEQDPDIAEIEIFAKLPQLKIKTPLGEYNPDFCYALKGANGQQVFLIVEGKGYETATNIPPKEKAKIDIAKKYFEALKAYYEAKPDNNIKIVFKERINKTQLSALINDHV